MDLQGVIPASVWKTFLDQVDNIVSGYQFRLRRGWIVFLFGVALILLGNDIINLRFTGSFAAGLAVVLVGPVLMLVGACMVSSQSRLCKEMVTLCEATSDRLASSVTMTFCKKKIMVEQRGSDYPPRPPSFDYTYWIEVQRPRDVDEIPLEEFIAAIDQELGRLRIDE